MFSEKVLLPVLDTSEYSLATIRYRLTAYNYVAIKSLSSQFSYTLLLFLKPENDARVTAVLHLAKNNLHNNVSAL